MKTKNNIFKRFLNLFKKEIDFISYGQYNDKIRFIENLYFQQATRKQNIKNLGGY